MLERTPAERVDRMVETVLVEQPVTPSPLTDPELRRLAVVAARLHAALPPVPAASGFEGRLGRRLAAVPRRQLLERDLFHVPAWLIVTGAVSSAAVGVTAFAVWRGGARGGGHGIIRRLGGS